MHDESSFSFFSFLVVVLNVSAILIIIIIIIMFNISMRKLAYEYDQMRFTILEEIKSTLPKSLFYNQYSQIKSNQIKCWFSDILRHSVVACVLHGCSVTYLTPVCNKHVYDISLLMISFIVGESLPHKHRPITNSPLHFHWRTLILILNPNLFLLL